MIAQDLRSGVERLGEMIAAASTIVPFTGAGISTECGIPDFRSPGGLWTRNRPIPFDEFVASQDARAEAWRRRFAMEATFAAAKPGRMSVPPPPLLRRFRSAGEARRTSACTSASQA